MVTDEDCKTRIAIGAVHEFQEVHGVLMLVRAEAKMTHARKGGTID